MILSRKLDPNTEALKKILRKKFSKYELDGIKINPEKWITKLELLKGDIQKLYVHIDNLEMMTNILLNLPEENQITVEILEDRLDDKDNPLTIERIRNKVLLKKLPDE